MLATHGALITATRKNSLMLMTMEKHRVIMFTGMHAQRFWITEKRKFMMTMIKRLENKISRESLNIHRSMRSAFIDAVAQVRQVSSQRVPVKTTRITAATTRKLMTKELINNQSQAHVTASEITRALLRLDKALVSSRSQTLDGQCGAKRRSRKTAA